MRLYLSTALLTLAWFTTVNAVVSALTCLAAAGLHRRAGGGTRRPGATLLLAVRLFPLVLSLVFAVGLFLPVHWIFESREGTESFGALLWGLALLSILLIGGSIVRVATALRASRRLQLAWRDQVGTARAGDRVVDHVAMPGVSLAGIFRTTIVIGQPVREALTCDELEVVLAHEVAHRQAWDNLKRFAIFASPDFFGYTRAARRLEQQWSGEVECLADARAVEGDSSRAAHLASALVKVARLAGAAARTHDTPLWSTFYERALLEVRVRRLVDGPALPDRASRLLPATLVGLISIAAGSAWLSGLPRTMHLMTEALVGLLP